MTSRLPRYEAKCVQRRCFQWGAVPLRSDITRERSYPCQYIDITRKAIDCATTLPLTVFGRQFVKRFALCHRSVVLSVRSVCLSVTFVHCGQTVGRIKMKLGMQVRFGLGHIVLDGDPAGPSSPPQRGTAPPIFGPYLLRPNGCMDQDVTWYGARPRPRRLCVRWGPRSPPQKKGRSPPPQFSAHFYCGQTAGCIKMPLCTDVGLSPGTLF